MKLLVYYSYNHKCFKTRFDDGFRKEVGDINGFDEELVAIVPLNAPQKKIDLKAQIIKFLEKVIDDLKYGRKRHKKEIVYIEKNRFPFWK